MGAGSGSRRHTSKGFTPVSMSAWKLEGRFKNSTKSFLLSGTPVALTSSATAPGPGDPKRSLSVSGKGFRASSRHVL